MPVELANQAVKSAHFLAARGIDPARIARDFGIRPEGLFDVVEGVTVHYTTDSARVPCSLIELRPPWTIKLPRIELDWRRLRAIRRERLQISQEKLATRLRLAGEAMLVPNGCTKRLMQFWEHGTYTLIAPRYQLALAYVLGYDVETIGQGFPAAVPQECAQQLVTVARLTEAFLVLAKAYEGFCELNERLTDRGQRPDAARSKRPSVGAVSVSVPQEARDRPRARAK